jgi:hypothetical protein
MVHSKLKNRIRSEHVFSERPNTSVPTMPVMILPDMHNSVW